MSFANSSGPTPLFCMARPCALSIWLAIAFSPNWRRSDRNRRETRFVDGPNHVRGSLQI